MPVAGLLEQTVEIPGGVEVGLDGDAIVVSAKGTTLRRKLSHPRIQIVVQGKQAKIRCEYPAGGRARSSEPSPPTSAT